MIRTYLRKHLNRNDTAISPVIGTILMVAATVIIGGAVYAAVNAYSGRASKASTDAGWKAQSMDTDGDGLEDTIKVTYLSGPDGASPTVTVTSGTSGVSINAAISGPTSWNPGDFATYQTAGNNAATAFVTVSQGGSTVLDSTLQLKE
jgi:flagellin-like protein